jgi:hypothetical protein
VGYRQIIVHAGLSKTGSTSIQESCRRQRTLLHRQGINYPEFSFDGEVFRNHSLPVILAVSDNPAQYKLGLKRRFEERGEDAASACAAGLTSVLEDVGDTLLLSSERIAGLNPEDLVRLRDLLMIHAEKLRVLVYIRSPFELLESTLQERAKAGAVVDAITVPGRARRRVENLQAVFANQLEVVDYHRAKSVDGGLVAGFLSQCGLPDLVQVDFEQLQSNPRISSEAFELMNAVNRQYPGKEQARHGVERAPGDLNALIELTGVPFGFLWATSPEVYQGALEEFQWFQREFGIEFPEPPSKDFPAQWCSETRSSLGSCLDKIDSNQIREFLIKYLARNKINW